MRPTHASGHWLHTSESRVPSQINEPKVSLFWIKRSAPSLFHLDKRDFAADDHLGTSIHEK